MNWSRAKTILIFMFLMTAVFQACVLYTSEKKAKNISPEIITSTTELLSAHGIEVDADIIPDSNLSLPSCDADNAISEYSDFAKLILGNDIEKSEGEEYTSTKGTVVFSGNSFEYTASSISDKSTKNELSAQQKAKSFLSEIGCDKKTAKEVSKKTDTGYEIIYTNSIGGVPIFNSQITVTVTGDEISGAYGNWFNITEKNNPVRLKSITAVLINIIKQDINRPAKITDIEVGYSIPENDVFQKSAVIVPVWRIEFEDGTYLLVDARNPQ